MDLLILGAGGHGRVVKEVAEATGKYNRINFVDDHSDIVVGKIFDLERLHEIYDSAFVGIGDNHLRNELIHKLETVGYEIPVLIHPTAYVSKSAILGKGTIVEPMAIVKAGGMVESEKKLEAEEVVLGYQKAAVKSSVIGGQQFRFCKGI